jgi:hypothetical protein
MKTKKFRTLPDKLMEENIEQELQWQTASVIRASVKPITSPAHKKMPISHVKLGGLQQKKNHQVYLLITGLQKGARIETS